MTSKPVFAALLFVLAASAHAEIVGIQWDAENRFVHEATVTPAKVIEVCARLPAGQHVRWQFRATAALDFDLHHHAGRAVVFTSKQPAARRAKGVLVTRSEQDYCWMFSNKASAPATLSLTLQR